MKLKKSNRIEGLLSDDLATEEEETVAEAEATDEAIGADEGVDLLPQDEGTDQAQEV